MIELSRFNEGTSVGERPVRRQDAFSSELFSYALRHESRGFLSDAPDVDVIGTQFVVSRTVIRLMSGLREQRAGGINVSPLPVILADDAEAESTAWTHILLAHAGTRVLLDTFEPQDYAYVYNCFSALPEIRISPDGQFDLMRPVRTARLPALPRIDIGPLLRPAPVPTFSQLADDVVRVSGLPTEQIADEIGVSRRRFQDWKRGAPASAEHERRLRQLRTLYVDALERLGVPDLRGWLLDSPRGESRTRHELLKAGLYTRVRREIDSLPTGHLPLGSRPAIVGSEPEEEDKAAW